MQCTYCNADMPDENGVCPNCGRQSQQESVSEVQPLSTLYWYDSWAYLLLALVWAAFIAVALAVGVHFLLKIESLQSCGKILWILVGVIPSLYFIWKFVYFFYLRFIQRYELSEKDIRFKKGFFNIKTDIILLEGLWGLKLRQSFLQRFFGLGTVTLFSDDVTSPRHVIKNLGVFPSRFYTLIDYLKRALDNSLIGVEKKNYEDPELEPWHNSLWDFVDETLWGIGITAVCCFLGYYVPYCAYGIAVVIPVLYWGWLAMYIADSVYFTTYQLSRSCIIKRSGIFTKKIDVYILYHLQDCELSQNLWQKMMCNVGNITLFIKWEDKEQDSQDVTPDKTPQKTASRTTKKVVLHGLMDYEKKFEKLREYWLDERHQRRTM